MSQLKKYSFYGCYFILTFFLVGLILDLIFPVHLNLNQTLSKEVRLESHELVHTFLTSDDKWRLKTTLSDVHPLYIDILIEKEDRFFRTHWGVNPFSLLRAFFQYLTNGKIVSGGSTLTMQVARLLDPRPRTLVNKILEILHALQLELHFSKNEILEMYLTLAPFGGNLEGVRAASLSYFAKSPLHLTPSEIAILVLLPQSPKRWEGTHFNSSVLKIRNQVLDFAFKKKLIDGKSYKTALKDPLPSIFYRLPRKIHHFARRVCSRKDAPLINYCSLNIKLQEELQDIAKRTLNSLPPGANLAVLVVHLPSSKVISYIGSGDFYNTERKGQVDYITAYRSPGSTLKPFIYGLGFDLGLIQPDSYLLNDQLRFGSYSPHNFDRGFSGMVTARKALQHSLNIPAVSLLNQIGIQRLLGLFHEANIYPLFPDKEKAPGLSISLGGLGMTLEQLVTLYTSLAQEGVVSELSLTHDKPSQEKIQILSTKSANRLHSILSYSPHSIAFDEKEKIAVKTGTSYGHRDALAIGCNQGYVVGIWVGHPEGRSLGQGTGETLAVPLLRAVFKSLPLSKGEARGAPKMKENSSMLDPKSQIISYHMNLTQDEHLQNPRILFPVDNAIFEKNDLREKSPAPLMLKVANGIPPYTWIINDQAQFVNVRDLQVPWIPKTPGFYEIVLMDKEGHSERVHIEIKEAHQDWKSQ